MTDFSTVIPQDPEATHQLHWTPGQYGKGAIFPDGSIHHWNTGKVLDGSPSHRQYIQQVVGDDIYQHNGRDAYSLFWVDKDGSYELITNGPGHDPGSIGRIDPRLHHSDQASWHFADNRSQQRAIDREQMDPVDFERKYDWDHALQYGYPEETEWVPTSELRKFMEYDRRGRDSWSSPERWNALGEHIKQNGFANPIMLEYNPDTNMAHMGEGHHRTEIALDGGIPAVPVRVVRSQRTSPTQITMSPKPDEAWKNHVGEYHWPSNIKPSHIGLSTVPAPNQQGWTFD